MTGDTRLVGKFRFEHALMLVCMAILTIAFFLERKDKFLARSGRLCRKNNVLRRLMAFDAFTGKLLVGTRNFKVGFIVIKVS